MLADASILPVTWDTRCGGGKELNTTQTGASCNGCRGDRETERKTERQRKDRHICRDKDRQTETKTNMDRDKDRHTDRDKDRQTDTKTDTQTDTHRETKTDRDTHLLAPLTHRLVCSGRVSVINVLSTPGTPGRELNKC